MNASIDKEPSEANALPQGSGSLQAPDLEALDRNARRGVTAREWTVIAKARDSDVKALAIQALGNSHRVQFGAADVHVVMTK